MLPIASCVLVASTYIELWTLEAQACLGEMQSVLIDKLPDLQDPWNQRTRLPAGPSKRRHRDRDLP